MDFKNIIYEKKRRIAYVTINRPERLNAVDVATSQEIYDAFHDFKDDPEVWVAIITGAGEKSFSTGNDLVATAESNAGGSAGRPARPVPFGGITKGFQCWKPMIAAVNGFCVAGGMEIALACDIRIAVPHAEFGLPESRWAIIPGAGGTQRLPRVLSQSVAMELMFTGRRINAERAYQLGLVSHVVPPEELIARAEDIAGAICDNGPLAIRAIKEAVTRGLQMPLDQGLALEDMFSLRVWSSEDSREGPLAFAQKRKPEYKGR
ncbi:MAG: enoyl-CoA hydratase-related protein [Dehalococcoidia bacterium]